MKKVLLFLVILVGVMQAQPQNPVFTTRQDTTIKGIVSDSLDVRIGWVTPQMYGAIVDGITDDANAFLTAKNYGSIYIPQGNYYIGSNCDLSGIEIQFHPNAVLIIDTNRTVKIDLNEYNIKNFGAKGTAAATGTGCSINAGTNILTVDNVSTFSVGSGIYIPDAGSGGSDLRTVVVGINGLQFTLLDNAGSTVSGVRCLENDARAFNTILKVIPQLPATERHTIKVPNGIFQITESIRLNISYVNMLGEQYITSYIYAYNCDAISIGNDNETGHVPTGYAIRNIGFRIGGGSAGIKTNNASQIIIDSQLDNLWFTSDFAQSTAIGIYARFNNSSITNCVFDLVGDGIILKDWTINLTIKNIIGTMLYKTLIKNEGTNCYAINISDVQYAAGSNDGLSYLMNFQDVRDLNIQNLNAQSVYSISGDRPADGIYLEDINGGNFNNIIVNNVVDDASGQGRVLSIVNCNNLNFSNVIFSSRIDSLDYPNIGIELTSSRNIFFNNTQLSNIKRNAIVFGSAWNYNVNFISTQITNACLEPGYNVIKFYNQNASFDNLSIRDTITTHTPYSLDFDNSPYYMFVKILNFEHIGLNGIKTPLPALDRSSLTINALGYGEGGSRKKGIVYSQVLDADTVDSPVGIIDLLKIEDVDFTGIPTDSTAVPSGYLYMRSSDGIIRRKY